MYIELKESKGKRQEMGVKLWPNGSQVIGGFEHANLWSNLHWLAMVTDKKTQFFIKLCQKKSFNAALCTCSYQSKQFYGQFVFTCIYPYLGAQKVENLPLLSDKFELPYLN